MRGMKGATLFHWLAGCGLILSGALCASALGPWADARLGPLSSALGGGALLAALFAIAFYHCRWLNRRSRVFFESLAQMDPMRAVDPADFPRLPAGHPLADAARQLQSLFVAVGERLRLLEQTSATFEVRAIRAAHEAERIRQVFMGLSDPVLAVNQYGELVLINRAARELTGLSDDEPAGGPLTEAIDAPKLVDLITTTLRRPPGSTRGVELEWHLPGQPQRWYRATACKTGDDGRDAGVVAVLRDISDRKALQRRHAEFVSSVSHEMKTPLAGIKAYVELLADGDAEDEATREEFLRVINSQTERLQRLIDNLLNIARIEAGVVEVRKEPRSLNEILDEALRVVRPAAEAKQIDLQGDLSPLYLGVAADRDMLLQAAINLLSNAVKYTRPGGRVVLRSRMSDEEVRFEVSDTGVGLTADDCEKVFEKFYRVKKDKDMASGTGLGLPLTKRIVEDVHGGRISVESVVGEGSTFIVTLPAAGQRVVQSQGERT